MSKNCPAHAKSAAKTSSAFLFDDFFGGGMADDSSPFLTPRSRRWAKNLKLRSAILAAVFLFFAFLASFSADYSPLSQLLLVFVYFLSGSPALIDSLEDLFSLEVNIDVLMTLAAFASVLLGSPLEGALLLVLFDLSGSIEQTVTSKAVSTLHNLHKLAPTTAMVVTERGRLVERSVREISIGTTILVRAGDVVPLDGTVIEGGSFVNLAHLTGENQPVSVQVDDQVPAGARTIEGALTVRVTCTGAESTLARIIRLITEAQDSKPRLQQWFDRLSQRYASTIIGLAAFFAAALPWLLGIPLIGDDGSIYRALAFLIAASPCALIIAVPTAYLSAISSCARKGILLKGGVTLDALSRCTTLALDKTGTVTSGELLCMAVEPLTEGSGDRQSEALAIAAALERNAKHPIAAAILRHTESLDIEPAQLTNFRAVAGYGVQAQVSWNNGNVEVLIGNIEFIRLNLPEPLQRLVDEKTEVVRDAGEQMTLLHIGDDLFLFHFQDTPRPEITTMLRSLQENHHMRLIMLTGDHHASAKAIAEQVGITEYHADLKPEDKLQWVGKLAKDGLVMIGDGINDAPSLAGATVGISMGAIGSATAIEASDIVLLHDNIEQLDWLVAKAKATRWIIRENLILATAVILMASIPALMGVVPLGLAVVLHEGGTLLVGLNGLRLLRR